jgi:hypothetical protein
MREMTRIVRSVAAGINWAAQPGLVGPRSAPPENRCTFLQSGAIVRAMDAVATQAQVTVDQIVAELIASSPTPARRHREALKGEDGNPGVVQRLVSKIEGQRRWREHDTLSRVKFASLLQDLNGDLLRAVTMLEFLQRTADVPWIGEIAYGPDGMLDALGGVEQIERLRKTAGLAASCRQRVTGSGRHSLADALGHPSPELTTAVAALRLRQLLRWPRGKASRERQLGLCEQLWRAAGGHASADAKRWISYDMVAKGFKQRGRAEAFMATCLLVDRTIGALPDIGPASPSQRTTKTKPENALAPSP